MLPAESTVSGYRSCSVDQVKAVLAEEGPVRVEEGLVTAVALPTPSGTVLQSKNQSSLNIAALMNGVGSGTL